ncbi:hypothetical protein [Streptomyces griseosporeus]
MNGVGIAAATVARMLDPENRGDARFLAPQEYLPYGAQPVLIADTTVYGAVAVERLLRGWGVLPRPWLVLVADAPARPAPAARYRIRALEGRLAGVARVPYLPVLRAVENAEEALQNRAVKAAAEKLRRRMEGK